jgi:hypothetical protein
MDNLQSFRLTESITYSSAIESKLRHLNSLRLSFCIMKLMSFQRSRYKIAEMFFILFGSSNKTECDMILSKQFAIKHKIFIPDIAKSIFVGMVIKLNLRTSRKFSFIEIIYLYLLLKKLPITSRLLQKRLHDLENNQDRFFINEKMKKFLQNYSIYKIIYNNPTRINEDYYFDESGLIYGFGGEIIISDPSINLSTHHNAGTHDFLIKSMESENLVFAKKFGKKIKKLDDETHIMLASRCASNYWHFLIEDATRLLVFKKEHPEILNPTIIISVDATQKSVEIVSKLYPESKILTVEGQSYYSSKDAFIPRSNLILDDEPRFGVHHTLTYSKGELLELRNEFLSSVRGVKPRVATKFYVRRKSGRRRILGEEELVRQLIANNFEIVDLSELEFEQQVSVFSHAEVVIGAAGAAWANLIFSSKGTRVLSLIGIDAAPWDMHEVIARDFGIKYQQLKLQHVRKEEFFYSNYLHRDVQINQNDIRKVFEWITTSSNF